MARSQRHLDAQSDSTLVSRAALRLRDAARTGHACDPVRDLIGASDVAAAYAVQRENVQDAASPPVRSIVGRKIGLTSPAVQQQLGVDQPDFGVLFDDMGVAGRRRRCRSARLLQPKVEAEIAFVLGADLDGDDHRPTQSARPSTTPSLALEIVDSRIADWDITLRRHRRRQRLQRRCSSSARARVAARRASTRATSRWRCTVDGAVVSDRHGRRLPRRPAQRAGLAGRAPRRTSASRCAPASSSCPAPSARWCPSRPATGRRRADQHRRRPLGAVTTTLRAGETA